VSTSSRHPRASRNASAISDVLEPELRTKKGARHFAEYLLTAATDRLRRGDYYCQRLGAHLSWIGDLGGWVGRNRSSRNRRLFRRVGNQGQVGI
jgi:hypothetical protein